MGQDNNQHFTQVLKTILSFIKPEKSTSKHFKQLSQ